MSVKDIDNIVLSTLTDVLEKVSELRLEEIQNNVEEKSDDRQNETKSEELFPEKNFSQMDSDTSETNKKDYDVSAKEAIADDETATVEQENISSTPATNNVTAEILKSSRHFQDSKFIQKEESFKTESHMSVKYMDEVSGNRKNNQYIKDEDPFIPPSESFAEKVLDRAESYFEDYNLFKNSFLLNHISRNKNGYVSLKLLTSLRRVRAVTNDYRVLAYSIKTSKLLELNAESTKVRRIEPIPKIEDTAFGKTLMIFNLPKDSSRRFLIDLFSKFGTVVSVGIYDIGCPDSDAYHERCWYFHWKIASKVYGIIEFEKYEQVVNALKDVEGHMTKGNEIIAVPLMPQIYKKERRYLKFTGGDNPSPKSAKSRGFRLPSGSNRKKDDPNMSGGCFYYKRELYWQPYRCYRCQPSLISDDRNHSHGQLPKGCSGYAPRRRAENRRVKDSLITDGLHLTENQAVSENGVTEKNVSS